MSQPAIPRAEYPRPQFVRDEWLNLNGEWEFEFDDGDEGERQRWHADPARPFSRKIVVPFCFQSKLSGIATFSPAAVKDDVPIVPCSDRSYLACTIRRRKGHRIQKIGGTWRLR
ncbi:hypothetical protein ACFFNY_08975 [Paenibacillus hodogayensis]|uniref:Glycoside hydrolase family 2 n=1 Tax=Paenibacillus hodogayensis TaxID=279208 RepID=A0ABV5VTS2_9BACL